MSRDRHCVSLTDRYLRLIGTIATDSFAGDQAAARAYTEDALVSCLMQDSSSFKKNPLPACETFQENIFEIVRSMDNPAEDLGRLLEAPGTRIRSQVSRDTGVVYTPVTVARFITDRTIGQWLLRQVRSHSNKDYTSVSELCSAGSYGDAQIAREALDKVQVLDSSCGTGVFLQAAAEALWRLKSAFENKQQSSGMILGNTLETNISGRDIDQRALKLARVRLSLLLKQSGHDGWKDIRLRLENVNALLPESSGDKDKVERFDIIVGNPPYMRVKSMYRGEDDGRKLKKDFAARILKSGLYRLQEGNLNLYKLFVERNLALLKDDGSMGLIIPSSFLNETTSMRLRQHVFETCKVEDIIEIPETAHAFDTVNQATTIVVCHRGSPGSRFDLRLGADITSLAGESISIDTGELKAITHGRMEVPLLRAPQIEWAMLKHLQKVPPFRGDERTGPIGNISVGNLDETLDRDYISETPTGDMFIKGIHLYEYQVDLAETGANPRWAVKEAFLEKRPSSARVIESPRIIGRNTLNKACKRRLKFALLPPGHVCGNSVKQIIITDPCIQPEYLLGLLNSAVLNWYFEVFCSQNNVRNYSIEALPIPRASKSVQDAIAFVAKAIIGSSDGTREYLDRKLMDALVYELYFEETGRLSTAVLAAMEKGSDPETLRRDDIRDMVDLIASRNEFKMIQQVTYRL